MPTSSSPGIPSAFIVLVVVAVIIAVGGALWRAAVLRKGGLNPFVAKEQLEVQLSQNLRNPAPLTSERPPRTIEERLAELDDLHERGVITTEERASARAKVIGGD